MARPEKEAAVKEIAASFEDAEAALLTEYRGLKVAEIAEVRGALREANAEYKVLKNTLARIAVRDVGLEDLVEWLEGPTAIVFVKGDVVEAAKALDEAIKKYPVLVVKGGTLRGGKLIDADQAKALAKLDSRETLLAKIAMMMNQPAQQTVNVFSALLRDLGSMLAQVAQKKESGELPGGEGDTTEPPPADKTEGEVEEGKPEGDTATPDAEAVASAGDGSDDDSSAPEAEDVGVPSPEEETADDQATSAEDAAVPEATAETAEDDEDTSDSTSDDEEEEEEK